MYIIARTGPTNRTNLVMATASDTLFCTVPDAAGEKITLAYQLFAPTSRNLAVPMLILVQGWMGVRQDWGAFAADLCSRLGCPVLVFDNRGMGQSTVPQQPMTLTQCARDVYHLAAHVQPHGPGCPLPRPFLLCGISMGGMIALHVADQFPSSVVAIVLGCTSGGKSHFAPHPTAPDLISLVSSEPPTAKTPDAVKAR